MDHVTNLVIQKLETMIEAANSELIFSKRKTINSLFPYAIFLEQGGQRGMIDAVLRTARVSDSKFSNLGKFMWHRVVLYISRLFEKQSPASLDRVITLISPYVPWSGALNNPVAVSRWAEAALAAPYTEEVGRNVVDALFQIAVLDFLRPHIPIEIWGWLKRRPSLPPVYCGLQSAGHMNTVAYVRTLGDIDILKSLFVLVWSVQWSPLEKHVLEMEVSIKEDFGEIGMKDHRRDLMERLDHLLGELGRVEATTSVRETKRAYKKLKNALLEVDGEWTP